MSYALDEISTQDGAPREIYRFIGSFNNYFYTSFGQELIIGGVTYVPRTIKRNTLKVGTQEEDQLALEVTLPFTDAMVQEYAYEQSPPSLVLEILRAHATDQNDTITLWKGRVTSFTVEGRVAKIRVPSIFGYIISGTTPSPRYQAPCNHILYDQRCQVSEVAFRETSNIVSFVNNILEVSQVTQVPADLIAGMVRLTRTGEVRMITGVVGTSVTVTYPFANIINGDECELVQGCDHSFATCKAKFNNGDNYGGCPLVPARNPFTSKI